MGFGRSILSAALTPYWPKSKVLEAELGRQAEQVPILPLSHFEAAGEPESISNSGIQAKLFAASAF